MPSLVVILPFAAFFSYQKEEKKKERKTLTTLHYTWKIRKTL